MGCGANYKMSEASPMLAAGALYAMQMAEMPGVPKDGLGNESSAEATPDWVDVDLDSLKAPTADPASILTASTR